MVRTVFFLLDVTTCNSDYTRRIFYRDPAVFSMLWSLYDSYQDKCQPLFLATEYLSMDKNDFNSPVYTEIPNYVLQPEACMVPFIDRQLLSQAIIPEFPDRDNAIKKMTALLQVNQSKMENVWRMSILRKEVLLTLLKKTG